MLCIAVCCGKESYLADYYHKFVQSTVNPRTVLFDKYKQQFSQYPPFHLSLQLTEDASGCHGSVFFAFHPVDRVHQNIMRYHILVTGAAAFPEIAGFFLVWRYETMPERC